MEGNVDFFFCASMSMQESAFGAVSIRHLKCAR